MLEIVTKIRIIKNFQPFSTKKDYVKLQPLKMRAKSKLTTGIHHW